MAGEAIRDNVLGSRRAMAPAGAAAGGRAALKGGSGTRRHLAAHRSLRG